MSDAAELRQAWRLVSGPAPDGPYTELAAAARALEVDYHGAPVLSFTLNGQPLTLSLVIDSGAVTGLSLRLGLEREPGGAEASIKLRRETRADREGKTRGIAREVQLDEQEFDDAVYVDATASDAEVRRIFATPSRRSAVLALLAAGATLELTHEAVTATWPRLGSIEPFGPEQVKQSIRHVLTLAGAGGPRERGPWRRGGWLQVLSGLSVFATPVYLLFVLLGWDFDGRLVWLGLGAGLGLAFGARGLVARLMRGDSGSFDRSKSTAVTLGFSLVMLGGGVPVHLNAELDRSAPLLELRGKALSVGDLDSENNTVCVEVAWKDGTKENIDLPDPVGVGDVVIRREHEGALGFHWGEHPRVALPGSPP